MDSIVTVAYDQQKLCDHLECIGNTPLIPVDLTINDRVHRVHLKLEGANPGESIKMRTALALVNDLEQRGLLREGSIIVESTSGNLGVAISMIASVRGYQFIAVVDPKATPENIAKMESLGAKIEMVRRSDAAGGYLLARLERVRELVERSPRYVWTNQYGNQANPTVHYQWTAPEIYRQMQQRIDAIFIAVSTGGTLAGIGRYLREVSPRTQVIAVDAHGSVIFGLPPASRKLTGIGASCPSNFITSDSYDSYRIVRDEEAFAYCRLLHETTAIKVGGSSGAALAACASYLAEHGEMRDVVCLCPDTGNNYATTIYNDEWLQEHEISLTGALGSTQHIVRSYP